MTSPLSTILTLAQSSASSMRAGNPSAAVEAMRAIILVARQMPVTGKRL